MEVVSIFDCSWYNTNIIPAMKQGVKGEGERLPKVILVHLTMQYYTHIPFHCHKSIDLLLNQGETAFSAISASVPMQE